MSYEHPAGHTTQLTPEQVLDKQFKILRFWKSEDGREFGQNMTDIWTNGASKFNVADHQAYLLDKAETFQATADMSLQIEMAAQQLPNSVLCPISLPIVEQGFLWLDRPWPVVDVNNETLYLRAIAWDSRTVMRVPDTENTRRGIALAYYADDDPQLVETKRRSSEWIPTVDPTLLHMNVATPEMPIEMVNVPERLMVAFWSLIRQPLVIDRPARAGRAFQRQFQRRGFQPRDITVVDLRQVLVNRPLGEKSEPTGAHFSWRFRYPVTGHWTRQYCSTLGAPRHPDGSWNEDSHRWTYIDEYYKGPEDAPILSKDRIYKVRR